MLSENIKIIRKSKGLSQEELAQRMGYRSKSSITKLEKGINDIPQSKVEELAAALQTTPAYLLGLDTPCPPPPAGTRRSRQTGSPAGAPSSYLRPCPLTVKMPSRVVAVIPSRWATAMSFFMASVPVCPHTTST
mgnify:CR=1 FL=1